MAVSCLTAPLFSHATNCRLVRVLGQQLSALDAKSYTIVLVNNRYTQAFVPFPEMSKEQLLEPKILSFLYYLKAASMAIVSSFGPAWCSRATTWRWSEGITCSTTFPVKISLPLMTQGTSTTSERTRLRAFLRSPLSGLFGAYVFIGSPATAGHL